MYAFLAGSVALLLQSVLFIPFTLLSFAPYIALVLLSSPLSKTLRFSAIAGSIVDILSDDPLGVHALNYTLTAALLFRFRKHFFYENPLHFSLFTIAISFISTLLQLLLLFLFDRRIPFAGKWILGDLIAMPMADGIYALIWFSAPLAIFNILRRHWSPSWNTLKQSLFRT